MSFKLSKVIGVTRNCVTCWEVWMNRKIELRKKRTSN